MHFCPESDITLYFWYKSDNDVKNFFIHCWKQAYHREEKSEIYPVVTAIVHETKQIERTAGFVYRSVFRRVLSDDFADIIY